MTSKRNRNKKGWAKRKARRGGGVRERSSGAARAGPPPTGRVNDPRVPIPEEPTELDQIGVLIVEEQLGLKATDMGGLRRMAARLPFEPCMSLLANLAGRVEKVIARPAEQLVLAQVFFGPSELVQRYRARMARDPKATIFGPQPLYILMRIMIDEARDAPITQELTPSERVDLMGAVVASSSVTESRTDPAVGPTSQDLLGYELQIGHFYSRPPWMEEMTRARELYRVGTEDEELLRSPDRVPVEGWNQPQRHHS